MVRVSESGELPGAGFQETRATDGGLSPSPNAPQPPPHLGKPAHGVRHPLKWIQEQGGWASAKVLLDTYGHFMPSESHGFADAIMGSNGSETDFTATAADDPGDRTAQFAVINNDPPTPHRASNPRSPIMHFTEPPPFFRNSLTSIVTGVTPLFRI
jgi:hypothetical protein